MHLIFKAIANHSNITMENIGCSLPQLNNATDTVLLNQVKKLRGFSYFQNAVIIIISVAILLFKPACIRK
jgi:hypothetical protein